MPLVDIKDLLRHASREGYCAFDLAGLDFLAAARRAAVPVAIQYNHCVPAHGTYRKSGTFDS